jgi:hypothetical protein
MQAHTIIENITAVMATLNNYGGGIRLTLPLPMIINRTWPRDPESGSRRRAAVALTIGVSPHLPLARPAW